MEGDNMEELKTIHEFAFYIAFATILNIGFLAIVVVLIKSHIDKLIKQIKKTAKHNSIIDNSIIDNGSLASLAKKITKIQHEQNQRNIQA